MYEKSVRILSSFYNVLIRKSVKPSTDLVKSCKYLNLKKDEPDLIVKASIALTLITSILCVGVLLLLFYNNSSYFIYLLSLASTPVIVNHFYSNYYKNKYYEERVKDLSELPDFFTLLITYLKINPNLENALIQANEGNFSKISEEVELLVNRLKQGKEECVKTSFIKIMKGFNNVNVNTATNSLISALSMKSKGKRNKLLNNSLNHLLNGVVEETKKFSRMIYTPIILLFGFGTIIPLVIISITPLIGLFNNGFLNLKTITLLFTASLIITKLVVNGLKKRSPPRFSQVSVKNEVKGFNKILLFILFIGISSPSILFIISDVLPYKLVIFKGYNTLFAYAGLSLVLVLYYYSKSNYLIKKRDEVKRLENELIQSFLLLGARINDGHSIESSLKHVSEVLNNNSAEKFLKTVYYNINHKGLSVEDAFNNVLREKKVASDRLKGLINLFTTSVKKHSLSASEGIIELCHYYERIRNTEKEMINSLSKNLDMIKLTSYFFTPMICALIINIQRLINSKLLRSSTGLMTLSFEPVNTEWLQLIISFYILLMSLTLSNLYSFLNNNNESVSTWNNHYKTLFSSSLVFTITLIISNLLLFKI